MEPKTLGSFLKSLQRASECSFDAATFASRLRIQKTVYLIQAMTGDRLVAFRFSDYFYGPYSPDLARAYYAPDFRRGYARAGAVDLPPPAKESLVRAIRRGNDFVEIAATLHSYVTKNRTVRKAEAFNYVRVAKPMKADQLEDAWEWLKKNGLLEHT